MITETTCKILKKNKKKKKKKKKKKTTTKNNNNNKKHKKKNITFHYPLILGYAFITSNIASWGMFLSPK